MRDGLDKRCHQCGKLHDRSDAIFTFGAWFLRFIITEANAHWGEEKFSWDQKIQDVNKIIFGHPEFRWQQKQIINAVLSGKDCLVIMPTGAGSLLFVTITPIRKEFIVSTPSLLF